VLADADKLRQILVNLTENAIKYSPQGGHVDVRVARSGDKVRFSVRDQGIGIPLDQQAHVFDRFHRLDPNMTRGVGGLGLGLYICHQLVERMHGQIWVTSREGVGSTFAFELPAATENAA
jgi:signal transduction histidine kinase